LASGAKTALASGAPGQIANWEVLKSDHQDFDASQLDNLPLVGCVVRYSPQGSACLDNYGGNMPKLIQNAQ
jgi:hypothetical protein